MAVVELPRDRLLFNTAHRPALCTAALRLTHCIHLPSVGESQWSVFASLDSPEAQASCRPSSPVGIPGRPVPPGCSGVDGELHPQPRLTPAHAGIATPVSVPARSTMQSSSVLGIACAGAKTAQIRLLDRNLAIPQNLTSACT